MEILYINILLDGTSIEIKTNENMYYYDYSPYTELTSDAGKLYIYKNDTFRIQEEVTTDIEIELLQKMKKFKSNESIKDVLMNILNDKKPLLRKNKFNKLLC